MSRPRPVLETRLHHAGPSLGDLLTARPSGLIEPECWAILCQAVQALQDLFLSDGASGESCIPLVTPSTLVLSSRGRVKLCQGGPAALGCGPPAHLAGYLAPECKPGRPCTDTEAEKMWIYGLGETLKRVTLTSHAATLRLTADLCTILTEMTRPQAASRASLMHLLDVISEYCKRRQQNRPFSHIVMDLHQEAMAGIETRLDTPWGPPAMPELRPRTRNRSDSNVDGIGTIPRRWISLAGRNRDPVPVPKITKEASTSMEDLSHVVPEAPGSAVRPRSLCVPDARYYEEIAPRSGAFFRAPPEDFPRKTKQNSGDGVKSDRRPRVRRNPVQRAASRLYRAGSDVPLIMAGDNRNCVGPEFVVRASLQNKQIVLPDSKGSAKKSVTVIMLNGQKLDVLCNPNSTTAGQLFEVIIQKEHIEENFMLGLSALIAGDFVFLPSDTRICKANQATGGAQNFALTLFMRVRFFLPSLRGIRGSQARHSLYLQLRRSILEHQLPCSFLQLIELDGLALQAEFGDYNIREHGSRDYFLLEHYVPETMSCAIENQDSLRHGLIKSHISRRGLGVEKAEEDFITAAQSLPHYGGHFYTATWILKDNSHKDVWLYVSAQGINLYERGKSTSNCGPQLYETFEWRSIQTLCYSKHYLCILPHSAMLHSSKLKKYKLKMDHKKSYFTFRLASLHHQFFLRLRTEYTSLQSLSQQFGIPLKDMKNETNSLCKLGGLTTTHSSYLDSGSVNAETEFKIEFRASSKTSSKTSSSPRETSTCRRTKSVADFGTLGALGDDVEEYQNKENERPSHGGSKRDRSGLILDSRYLSGLGGNMTVGNVSNGADKRRGVKMGTRMFGNGGQRVSRSMEAVNDYLEEMSLQSVSLHCSSTSIISKSTTDECVHSNEAYILESSIKSTTINQFLPDFHETLSDTLLEKLDRISFVEERILSPVSIERDSKGSLGVQITEGSDGNVYVQSVIVGGPAHLTGKVLSGDQVVAVDGRSLLGMKYRDSLNLLTKTGRKVEFVLARVVPNNRGDIHTQETLRLGDNLKSKVDLSDINETHLQSLRLENTMNKLKRLSNHERIFQDDFESSPIEKHLTESCKDVSNLGKHGEVPYHKHIRYEIENEKDSLMSRKTLPAIISKTGLNRTLSKSCSQIMSNDRAVVVDMIPKLNPDLSKFRSLDRKCSKSLGKENCTIPPPIALPRSLGLSRKWRGPVKYPVTPVKKVTDITDIDSYHYLSTSDDEQVFI